MNVHLLLPLMLAAPILSWFDDFGDRPADAPVFPAEVVDRIEVTWAERSEIGSEPRRIVVSDRERIASVLSQVKSLDRGWYKTWHTFPNPRYTIVFEQARQNDREPSVFLWFTPGTNGGWIGGRDAGQDADGNRLRNLSAEESAKLADLLGLPAGDR